MRITYATEATPGRVNEDYTVIGPDWVVLLDGATAPAGVTSGCVHDVAWLVSHLGGALATQMATSHEALPGILAAAISSVRADHGHTCDLDNPASPSSTVALLRNREGQIDYLVLCDSPIIFDTDDGVLAVTDDRLEQMSFEQRDNARFYRNQSGGFWVASTKPEAAYQAVSGSIPTSGVKRIAVLSDGASRYVDRFALGDWGDLLDLLDSRGPNELIRQVRSAESAETEEERARYRGKPMDDATVVFLTLQP